MFFNFSGREFAKRVKIRRKELHLTQEQLASKTDVSKPTVVRWEQDCDNKGYLKLDDLIKLSKVLDCSVAYLIGEIDYYYIGSAEISRIISLKEEALDVLIQLSDSCSRNQYAIEALTLLERIIVDWEELHSDLKDYMKDIQKKRELKSSSFYSLIKRVYNYYGEMLENGTPSFRYLATVQDLLYKEICQSDTTISEEAARELSIYYSTFLPYIQDKHHSYTKKIAMGLHYADIMEETCEELLTLGYGDNISANDKFMAKLQLELHGMKE